MGGGGVVVTAVLELFSLLKSDAVLTVAILTNDVPAGVPGGMRKTMVNVAMLPFAMLAALQLTVPLVAPTPGSVQLKPAAGVTETKLHPPLTGSFSVTVPASLGPKFVTVMVKETFVSALAVLGPVLFNERSLLGGVVVVAVLELFAPLESVGEVTVAVFGNDVFGGALSGM